MATAATRGVIMQEVIGMMILTVEVVAAMMAIPGTALVLVTVEQVEHTLVEVATAWEGREK